MIHGTHTVKSHFIIVVVVVVITILLLLLLIIIIIIVTTTTTTSILFGTAQFIFFAQISNLTGRIYRCRLFVTFLYFGP